MSLPFDYDHGVPLAFGGALPHPRCFDESKVIVLPIPVDRTTSYVSGTRNGPHEILQASSHMELWDEEVGTDVHGVGIFTLPEMELPFGDLAEVTEEIRRVAFEILSRDKFLVSPAASIRSRRRSSSPPRRNTMGCRCFKSTPMRICGTRTWAVRTTMRARCGEPWNTQGSPR